MDNNQFNGQFGNQPGNQFSGQFDSQFPQNQFGQQPAVPPKPMKWYKFLVYFFLWFGAVLNLINSINIFTGNVYRSQGVEPGLAYMMFGGLKTFDIFRGILTLLLAFFIVLTAIWLLQYKRIGVTALLGMYIANAVISIISLVGEYLIVTAVVPIEFQTATLIGVLIGVGFMFVVNMIYFDKRRHLFTN